MWIIFWLAEDISVSRILNHVVSTSSLFIKFIWNMGADAFLYMFVNVHIMLHLMIKLQGNC